jgi:hypothetical protein
VQNILGTEHNISSTDQTISHTEHHIPSVPPTAYMFEKFFTVNLNPQIYFSGEAVPGNENENVPFNLTLDVIRFFIWQCKLNKKKPTMSYNTV